MSERNYRKQSVFDLPTFASAFDLGAKVVEAQRQPSKPSLDLNKIVMLGSPSFIHGFHAGVKEQEQKVKEPEMKKAAQEMLRDLQRRMPSLEDPEFDRKWKDKEPDL